MGEIMPKNASSTEVLSEEIKIPFEYVEKIDRIIKIGISIYPSREEFIEAAVEMKLLRFKAMDKELDRGIFSTQAKLKNNKSIETDIPPV